jgi:hypothetical protein
MNTIRRIDGWIDSFMRLSPVTKRVLTTILCVVLLCLCGPLGAAGYDKLVTYVSFIAAAGLCWSTGFWYVLRGALILLAWWLRIFR